MRYRNQKDVAKELGLTQDEARFLVQWLIGQTNSSKRPAYRFLPHRAGQTRLIDETLYERLKEFSEIFKLGKDIYMNAPAEVLET